NIRAPGRTGPETGRSSFSVRGASPFPCPAPSDEAAVRPRVRFPGFLKSRGCGFDQASIAFYRETRETNGVGNRSGLEVPRAPKARAAYGRGRERTGRGTERTGRGTEPPPTGDPVPVRCRRRLRPPIRSGRGTGARSPDCEPLKSSAL